MLQTFLDECGAIRTMEVQVENGVYIRPLEYIVPLELSCEEAQAFC